MFPRELLTTQLILNWLTRILFFTSLSALLPMSQFIEDIGGNKTQIGIVMSAFAAGVLLFRPIVGKNVDHFGRKIVLIFGSIVFVIAPVIYMAIHSVNTLIPIRVFHGLGLAAFGTASITLITDAAPEKHRGAAISYTGMVNTIAFAGGPALGFYVFETWGHNTLFSMASVLSLLCLLLSLFIRETKSSRSDKTQTTYLHVVKQRQVIVPALIVLLVGLVHGGVMFYIPLFLKNIAINKGLFYTTYGVAAFLIRVVVGPMSDKMGRAPFLVIALALLSAGVFALSQTAGAILMLTSAVLYGLGFGSHQPTLTALVADGTTEETRGKVFSFYYGGFDLGISLAGVILGAIAEQFGIKTMFLVCSGLTLLGMGIFVTSMQSQLSTSLKFALQVSRNGKDCDICDQFQEVSPKQAEAYFKTK